MTTLYYTGGAGGTRLDRFILTQLPGLASWQLQKYLLQNKIKLNGKKCPLETRLSPNDEIRLYLPDCAPVHAPQVLYEDDGLLALYKPAGLVSLNESQPGADSLLRRALAYLCISGDGGKFTPKLCHRLDTGTSGILLMAKTACVYGFVTGLLREGRLQKTYYGLITGHLQPPSGVLRGHLIKDTRSATARITTRATPGAKPAETAYDTVAVYGPLSLLRLMPRTGRTHQLRVQLAQQAGAPLLGDSKYGDAAANRRWHCRYQCLCAAEVRFPPINDDQFSRYSKLSISCEKPWFYQKILDGHFE